MALEYLKKLFSDKPLTFDEFAAAYDAQESAKDGVKLINLSDGGYVSAQKFKDKETELKTATDTIADLQSTVKKFDGVDVEKLKASVADAQKKFDSDLAAARRDSAIHIALLEAKARNPKAARALLDDTKITLNADGSLSGLDIDSLKKSDPYLFEIEQKRDEGSGHASGKPANGTPTSASSVQDDIREQLFGTTPEQK